MYSGWRYLRIPESGGQLWGLVWTVISKSKELVVDFRKSKCPVICLSIWKQFMYWKKWSGIHNLFGQFPRNLANSIFMPSLCCYESYSTSKVLYKHSERWDCDIGFVRPLMVAPQKLPLPIVQVCQSTCAVLFYSSVIKNKRQHSNSQYVFTVLHRFDFILKRWWLLFCKLGIYANLRVCICTSQEWSIYCV